LLNQQYKRLVNASCSLKPMSIALLEVVIETREFAEQCHQKFFNKTGCL